MLSFVIIYLAFCIYSMHCQILLCLIHVYAIFFRNTKPVSLFAYVFQFIKYYAFTSSLANFLNLDWFGSTLF